jgi:hypothetical protein
MTIIDISTVIKDCRNKLAENFDAHLIIEFKSFVLIINLRL